MSPTYIGELCDFPLKIDRAEILGKENVSFATPTSPTVTAEEFRDLEKLNSYLWKNLFGAKKSDY